MIQADKKPKEDNLVNLTDYSSVQPEGTRHFYAFIDFADETQYIMLDRIFAKDRLEANQYVLNRFADCLPYMQAYRLYEQD